MLQVHYFEYLVSERVQAYSSKIIQYFQLQNHEYCYSGVSIVLWVSRNPSLFIYTHKCKSNFSISINSTFFW